MQARAASLEVYGGYPTLSDVALSPKGDLIAYATTDGDKRVVLVYSLTEKKVVGGLNVAAQKVRGIRWAGEDCVLISSSETGLPEDFIGRRGELVMTEVYRLSNHSQDNIIGVAFDAMNISAGPPEVRAVNGRPIAYITGVKFASMSSPGHLALFARDPDVTQSDMIVEGAHAQGWLVDDGGKVVAEQDYDESTRHWSLKLRRGFDWQEVYGVDTPIDQPNMEGLSADGKSVVVQTAGPDGYRQRAFLIADGSAAPAPFSDSVVADVIYDPLSARIIGTVKAAGGIETTFFSQEDKERWHEVSQAFAGEQVELISASDDKKKLLVRVTGQNDGVAYVLIDLDTMMTTPIGRAYQGIGPSDLAPVTNFAYSAADGTALSAYLTLPQGRDAKNLPLVVLPHGGPEARDMPGFDWWAQALASRGYAVLQPAFRGSGGYGWALFQAGFGQWGRKMQTDLSDGVRALAAKGTIDPKRVCIVGGSYGGYAALAGATLDPGVYRCAVSLAGISDLTTFRAWVGHFRPASATMRYLDRFWGTQGGEDSALDAISPVKHVDRIAVPVLLIHGKDDTVVPLAQSQEMADAMRAAGKDVTFVTMEGEDHWLSRAETRTQALTEMVAFLEKNNPP